jgi:dynein heavy chain
VLYFLSEEQLSKQKHYDFGLRNILSVLRTAGATKRANLDSSEDILLYRTLRDMNLSKFVAQDVPLFLSLLADLFPSLDSPPVSAYPKVEAAIAGAVNKRGLIEHPSWVKKIVQLYETTLVRHGIMLVGPSGGGKTRIFQILQDALSVTNGIVYRMARLNPKAIRAAELYGEVDPLSGEWTTGVFAAIWARYNNRSNKYNTWIIEDGPVDAIWIEDLNTVLDDNRILTLANGDRIPMTDNCKIMFENEQLNNASPATVSRAGIIYVSESDLDWKPIMQAWIKNQAPEHQGTFYRLFERYVGVYTPEDPGKIFEFLSRNCSLVMSNGRVGMVTGTVNLLTGLLNEVTLSESHGEDLQTDLNSELERLFIYAVAWTIGGLLETADRRKLDAYLREVDAVPDSLHGEDPKMPELEEEGDSVFEYFVNTETLLWEKWKPPIWEYPVNEDPNEKLDFSNLLVPTMDSTRTLNLLRLMHEQKKPVMMVGGPGTAKTSCALMFFRTLDPDSMLVKPINFSFATSMGMFQSSIESALEKRGGKNFGPPNGKAMTVFLDDLSMPEINEWADQPTLEIVRQLVEDSCFAFLEKDKRGDMKTCEDLQYIAAMGQPGGGKNDIPNRMKRQLLNFNLVLPSITSIDDIYGQMLRGRFPEKEFDGPTMQVVDSLTTATIELWQWCKERLLPTPAKFHYVFNMRDLSRIFCGILLAPKDSLKTGGCVEQDKGNDLAGDCAAMLLALWRNECERVFCDKLTNYVDKKMYRDTAVKMLRQHFPTANPLLDEIKTDFVMFMRDDIYDEDGLLEEEAPQIYEIGGTLDNIRERVNVFIAKHNEEVPSQQWMLVLFEDALYHLLRISRVICTPRGSALLVGVGGSGKQSLTRLAAYIARQPCFQITLTKTYNVGSLMDDLRELYRSAGGKLQPTTFLFTDSEIKQEAFLEYLNSVLMTGQVPGLFAKDEMLAMCGEIRPFFVKERPELPETQDNLAQYFIDKVRDNLHCVLCMSPLNPLFPVRARRFPGLVNGCTIDWFLPWPQSALMDVSGGFIRDFPVESTDEVKASLIEHMGTVHQMTVDTCDEYFNSMRRKVYQTPKSYLSFIQSFKEAYTRKMKEVKEKEERINLGLEKLITGAKDVEAMKIVLAQEQVKLDVATKDTEKMLGSLQISSMEAKKEGDVVQGIKTKCEADAERIAGEKALCEEDLAKAQPFVDEANNAINSIKPADITVVKKLGKPADIIKLVFDVILILFQKPLKPIKPAQIYVSKLDHDWWEPSWESAGKVMADPKFLAKLVEFGAVGKDKMNEETIEFMLPYIEFEFFTPKVAKGAAGAAEGLCTFARAMKFYYEASKIVKPKLEALAIADAQLAAAMKALGEAETRLAACKARLQELQDMFEEKMAAKAAIEDGARALQKKMEQASALINGLAGERIRWTDDSQKFQDMKIRMVGDCAVACAFTSYCGPFNQEYRAKLIYEKFCGDCIKRGVPVTESLDIIDFMVDIGTRGDWSMQGLPSDPLSIQNGILVTNATRFPLLVDPQGQAISWISRKEAENLPSWDITQINHPKLKDQLEFCMSEGKAFIIANVQETIDPMLDPVLEKVIVKKGRNKYINVADTMCEYNDDFRMYFITRLPNPHFSPELQAKTTVIDFTVTMKGLEEQLLGKVIGKEQKALEDQLNEVLESVNSNNKALMQLDALLLERLTGNKGNLLDDVELIGVLANTKAKASEVKEALIAAEETKVSISEKREQYRPVACRGSILYFAIVEMSNVNVMYQTSLAQFLVLFMRSMDEAEKAALASKRVANIIDTMTYITYRYINRGLYEEHKLTFVLIMTLKVLVVAGHLTPGDVSLFLRGGAALDVDSVRKCTFDWMTPEAWLNVIELSQSNPHFRTLPDTISRNEAIWRRWYEENEPEGQPIPDYEQEIAGNSTIGPFLRLLMVRCLRMDRTTLMVQQFIKNTEELGPRYTEPVTDTIESIYAQMTAVVPVIYLLSIGADPTDAIETLCRKKKNTVKVVSMGQGQEPVAIKAINTAAVNGSWVLLQNCELGLGLMMEMEEMLKQVFPTCLDSFRLFITAGPHPEFPLGLLQMCTKVTNEPPAGLRAGLMRSYTVMVDQERLERVETSQWRQLVFALCFLHSIVQERRKFGPLGWCIPYEYNAGDLTAILQFLEKHLYSTALSWPTLQYMTSEVQYGGKITDDLDRVLFNCYAKNWVTPETLGQDFMYNPEVPVNPIPGNFEYTVPDFMEHSKYMEYLSGFPEVDSPELFGLHPNADLTFRVKEVNKMLQTLGETQPKQGGGGGGVSREDLVYEKAGELLERFPEDYKEDDYMRMIRKLGGLSVPLNIFLFQEIQRLQTVIGHTRAQFTALQLAIKGEVTMTQALLSALDDISDAKVPNAWLWTIGGDEFSWLAPTLGLWFTGMIDRDSQVRKWLEKSRPSCFWMSGWSNPQGFLTAMKQEVTRLHKADKWALDDMMYHSIVTDYADNSNVKKAPEEGVYIHGLFLDGCGWSMVKNKADRALCESEPKKLFAPLPVLWVSAVTRTQSKQRRTEYGALGPYECPCYKYPARTGRFYICIMYLPPGKDFTPDHWCLRGVALTCSSD